MTAFTRLELATLQSIFAETPDLAPALQRQLDHAVVTKRENTGHGILTDIAVSDDAPAVDEVKDVLGYETGAHIKGLEHGVGFVLFLKHGKLTLLDMHAWADDTSSLDPVALVFEIFRVPEGQQVPQSPF